MLKKLSKAEIICYFLAILVGITGLTFIILGIVGDAMPVSSAIKRVQANFSWRYLGLILVAVAVVFALIVLLVNAKKVDRITDKEQRRKQRLNAMISDVEKKDEETILVKEGKIVEGQNTEEKNITTN